MNEITTDANSLAVFDYNQSVFSSRMLLNAIGTAITSVGAILTIISFAATVVYWNHNC